MKIVTEIEELVYPDGALVALVPTMGALHRGHVSLMKQAKATGAFVVVSIFVNPTQFGPNEDFTRYPRTLERDAELAEAAGVDLIFAPTVETMYPRRTSKIALSEVTEHFEGERRPGHFDGVCTVVAKLFNMVRPNTAFFGLKDLQQCAVVDRMVRDLNFPVKLHFCQTEREPDGLALSSRNVYLTEAEREVAPTIYATLQEVKRLIELSPEKVVPILVKGREQLASHGFDVDYLDLVDRDNFCPVTVADGNCALIVAAKLGKTRLIDNLAL